MKLYRAQTGYRLHSASRTGNFPRTKAYEKELSLTPCTDCLLGFIGEKFRNLSLSLIKLDRISRCKIFLKGKAGTSKLYKRRIFLENHFEFSLPT